MSAQPELFECTSIVLKIRHILIVRPKIMLSGAENENENYFVGMKKTLGSVRKTW